MCLPLKTIKAVPLFIRNDQMHDFVMRAAQKLKGAADSIDFKVFFNVPSEGKIGWRVMGSRLSTAGALLLTPQLQPAT